MGRKVENFCEYRIRRFFGFIVLNSDRFADGFASRRQCVYYWCKPRYWTWFGAGDFDGRRGSAFVRGLQGRRFGYGRWRDGKLSELHQLRDDDKRLRLIKIDVSDDRSIRTAFGEIQKQLLDKGGLNLLINNAGILQKEGVTLQEPHRDVFLDHFDVNAVGTVMTTAAFLPLLKKAASAGECARVVNLGSVLGCIGQSAVSPRMSPHQNVAYGMSKAALHHFSKMMALDESDIVTVAIHPGWVKTEMGGANAPTSVFDSVSNIVKRMCKLTKKDSGNLLSGEKELLP